jgi:GNAT superfamily N-acetyltransferase
MFVRLALEKDREAIRENARNHVREVAPRLIWSDDRADETFNAYLSGANPTVFVIEDNREIVGHLVALMIDNAYATGFFIVLDAIYVKPAKRGTRAAAKLMHVFNEWADRLWPTEIVCRMSNPGISERTLRFLQCFGFEQSGMSLRREPGD